MFHRLEPTDIKGTVYAFDYDFRGERFVLPHPYPDRTKREYLQSTRWPQSDIDVFVYGLSAPDAHAKLISLLAALRRTAKMRTGVDRDIQFIKTSNTVTFDAGPPFRKVQVITRLYKDKSDILNSFDIDSCCIGFDGQRVMLTERAANALRTKINPVRTHTRTCKHVHNH
jgi:hypothetical protein